MNKKIQKNVSKIDSRMDSPTNCHIPFLNFFFSFSLRKDLLSKEKLPRKKINPKNCPRFLFEKYQPDLPVFFFFDTVGN